MPIPTPKPIKLYFQGLFLAGNTHKPIINPAKVKLPVQKAAKVLELFSYSNLDLLNSANSSEDNIDECSLMKCYFFFMSECLLVIILTNYLWGVKVERSSRSSSYYWESLEKLKFLSSSGGIKCGLEGYFLGYGKVMSLYYFLVL